VYDLKECWVHNGPLHPESTKNSMNVQFVKKTECKGNVISIIIMLSFYVIALFQAESLLKALYIITPRHRPVQSRYHYVAKKTVLHLILNSSLGSESNQTFRSCHQDGTHLMERGSLRSTLQLLHISICCFMFHLGKRNAFTMHNALDNAFLMSKTSVVDCEHD
jgi:hypothetical protein